MNKTFRDFVFYGSQLFVAATTIVSVASLSGNHSTNLVSGPKQYSSINNAKNKNPKNLANPQGQMAIATTVDQVENDSTNKSKDIPTVTILGFASANRRDDQMNNVMHRSKMNTQVNKTNNVISFSDDQFAKIQNKKNDWPSSKNHTNLTNLTLVNRSIQEKNQYCQVYSSPANDHFSITNEGVLTSLTSKGKTETKLIIPQNVVKILADAFNDCNKDLETIDIESTNLTIDPAALKPIPAKTNFRVVNDAVRDDLIKHGIERNRISVLNQGYNWNAIIIASLATVIASGIIFKIIHILIKRHKKKNKEKTEV